MLKLAENIIATDDGLGIYLPKISAICIADLHIGIELALLNEGTYIPIDQYTTIEEKIIQTIEQYKPELLIINGDFKHEFGRASTQEWMELQAFVKVLNEHDVELEIVRGNHDNYLKTILEKSGRSIQEPYFIKSSYLFIHGHQRMDEIFEGTLPNIDWVFLAHEHPSIVLYDESQGKHKFKCYLIGKWKKYKILVLPAYSPFASGTIMNTPKLDKILSPILKKMSIDNFKPVVVDSEDVLIFPTLKDMIKHGCIDFSEEEMYF